MKFGGEILLKRAWWQGFRSVVSDEGYRVRLLGLRRGLEYSEGDHVVRVGVERAAGPASWIIYATAIEGWLPPFQHESLAEETRREIRERIISALDFLNLKYHLAE
jgi:hypothetical protein